MLSSRFCFGPPGGGHGQRQIQAVLAGCVPVIIADGVLQAFEPILDWNDFAVRVAEADIPRLHKILAAISPEEYELKVSRMRCAAQHMAFSLSEGASMGESGRFDAFETLLEILRAKAAHPDVPFERLRRVDAQLDAFMECRDPEAEEEGERSTAAGAGGRRAAGGGRRAAGGGRRAAGGGRRAAGGGRRAAGGGRRAAGGGRRAAGGGRRAAGGGRRAAGGGRRAAGGGRRAAGGGRRAAGGGGRRAAGGGRRGRAAGAGAHAVAVSRSTT
ncbi:hypothetical protein HYH03_012523 [Edaphochlamys debaryana]|uniref:Exostosin GT47 domain-containing protein n=1 Tax=Edaphochlamys debaryana TaxID=47281 RepID=A0A836BVC1_9CHLO|nr:hypothetical protein HYH03_012523 [Edaphochlamys debaryana]|eukprot:KAG2488893.1 hypothetical protein HYH03_012523 [Edaphochlamys debaryana]